MGGLSFQSLAPITGGRAYLSRNDLDNEIGTAIREGSKFYTLSYVPSAASGSDAQPFRNIRVRLDRPGLIATTRTGYYDEPRQGSRPASAAAKLNQDLRKIAFDLGAAANSSLVYDGLHLAAQAHRGPDTTFTIAVQRQDLDDPPQRRPCGSGGGHADGREL